VIDGEKIAQPQRSTKILYSRQHLQKDVPSPTSSLITLRIFDLGSIPKLVTVLVNLLRFLILEFQSYYPEFR
jgi:hypothetical protein